MKPYTYAVLAPQQRNFNYRLSRARMVTEGAYGQLEGRWRVLLRKCESSQDTVHIMTLACMVLHNICIAHGDAISKKLNLSLDANGQKRYREDIRKLLEMRNSSSIRDSSQETNKVRNALCEKLWIEKENWQSVLNQIKCIIFTELFWHDCIKCKTEWGLWTWQPSISPS